jgi:hypothetical protein
MFSKNCTKRGIGKFSKKSAGGQALNYLDTEGSSAKRHKLPITSISDELFSANHRLREAYILLIQNSCGASFGLWLINSHAYTNNNIYVPL